MMDEEPIRVGWGSQYDFDAMRERKAANSSQTRYLEFRQTLRDILDKEAGIKSNPAWTEDNFYDAVRQIVKERDDAKAKLDFLKSKGIVAGMAKESGKDPYMAYVIAEGSELHDQHYLDRIFELEEKLRLQQDEIECPLCHNVRPMLGGHAVVPTGGNGPMSCPVCKGRGSVPVVNYEKKVAEANKAREGRDDGFKP